MTDPQILILAEMQSNPILSLSLGLIHGRIRTFEQGRERQFRPRAERSTNTCADVQ